MHIVQQSLIEGFSVAFILFQSLQPVLAVCKPLLLIHSEKEATVLVD